MYLRLHHCEATVKIYFSLNELTYQSKKTFSLNLAYFQDN